MGEENKSEQLLTEIRDLLAKKEHQDKEYLAASERLYKQQLAETRGRDLFARPFQWAALFAIVYFAVSLALKNSQ